MGTGKGNEWENRWTRWETARKENYRGEINRRIKNRIDSIHGSLLRRWKMWKNTRPHETPEPPINANHSNQREMNMISFLFLPVFVFCSMSFEQEIDQTGGAIKEKPTHLIESNHFNSIENCYDTAISVHCRPRTDWIDDWMNSSCRVLLGFPRFYLVLPGFSSFSLVLPGFTEFYPFFLDFTGFYWVLQVLIQVYRVFLGVVGL